MANFFDQFDAPSKPTGGNFFDQFDAPSETKKPEGGLVASLKQTGGQMVKSAGQLAADVLPGVDRDNALTRTGQGIIDANPTAVHSLSDVAESPWTATKEAVGNAAASIGGVVGARLLGQGITAAAPLAGPAAPLVAGIGQGISWLGPTAMAALPSYGGIREQQIAADPNNEGSLASKALAGAGAATVGLIENRFGPQEWALKALSQGGRDALAKQFAANSLAGAIGKGAIKGAAIEGAEELVQNPIEQLASYQDPTTAANLQDTAFGGVMGALGGGVLGGGAGGLSRTITPSQAQQPAQPPQPAIDPNAGPMSKAASMATQTPELNPLAFTPMQPTGPELETDAQTQERLRAAQFRADALPFEPSLSFEQEPQPVRATTQDGMPFERIGPQDYDTLNPIRVGEGELLDAERPTAGRTRAPDAIEGQAQQRIGVADDGQQGNQAPMRTLGERVHPAQGDNAPTRALPYFTDQKAEQSARKALPFATEPAAQKKAAELSKKRNEPFTVIPHPALADRFAVVPFRNLADRAGVEPGSSEGQAVGLPKQSTDTPPGSVLARSSGSSSSDAGIRQAQPRSNQVGTSSNQRDGSSGTPSLTSSLLNPDYRDAANVVQGQNQPATESVSNGLPPAEQTNQEAEAARGQEGAKETRDELLARYKRAELFSDESFALSDRLKDSTRKEVGAKIAAGEMPVFDTGSETFATITPSAQKPGSFQVTRYNRYGVMGDSQYASVDDALAREFFHQKRMIPQAEAEQRFAESLQAEAKYQSARNQQSAQTQPQAPQSDQFGNANKMVEQPSTQQEGRREEVAPKPKNLLQLVRKAGGVSMNRLSDVTGDNNPRRAGAVGVFTKNGMDLDGLAELLQQNGFMTEAEVSDVGSGAERATELLRQALAGERPTSLEDVDAELAKQEERKYRDRIRQRANEMGIRTAVRKFEDIEADVLAQEEQAALAPEDRSAYALDLAGYNEQTPAVKSFLDDAFDPFDEAAEGQSVEAAMRSLGFTEEEINAELQDGKGAQEAEEADARGTQGRAGSADARQADQGQGQQEGLTLDGYTNADIAQRESEQRARDEAEQQAQRDAERRAQADAERGSFILTGSDRPADLLAAQGQGGLFDAPQQPAKQSPSDRFRAEVERRKQERDKEFVHNGVRIYPATINVAGERKQMWGVESSENKAKREAGERYGFGDSLFDTKEQATAAADRQIQRDAERAEFERRKTEIEAEKQAEAAARKADTINGFLDGKAPNTQELIRKALNKQYRFDGVIRSVRQQVEWLNENGTLDVRTFEEPKIKPMSRTQFNRASQREQDAHEKKMRDAGTKTVYLVSGSELGKYAYDYAQHLIARKTATPQQAQEQPKQAEQPSAPASQEAQPESIPVNPELESLFESLDGTSTRKANKAKKAIQADPRADKINMVQDKFLDILQALGDSGAVKINCK